jgi:hypothetical protein
MLSVKAAVLENGDGHPCRPGGIDHTKRLRCVRGQRLVHNHRDPGLDAPLGLGGVNAGGSCKDHEIQTLYRKQRFEVSNYLSVWHLVSDLLRAQGI